MDNTIKKILEVRYPKFDPDRVQILAVDEAVPGRGYVPELEEFDDGMPPSQLVVVKSVPYLFIGEVKRVRKK